MPIPPLVDGWLPVGEHDCSLEEIEGCFAGEGVDDHRRTIFAALCRHLEQPLLRRHGDHCYVDGSFTSAKPRPSDVDVLLGVHPARWKALVFNQGGMSPNEVLQRLQGKMSFGGGRQLVHGFAFPIGSAGYKEIQAYFQQSDRVDEPAEKGVLRVKI